MSPPTDLACPSWLVVSASTQALLAAAAQSWNDDTASEGYIHAALAQPDVELDALVSAYQRQRIWGRCVAEHSQPLARGGLTNGDRRFLRKAGLRGQRQAKTSPRDCRAHPPGA